MTSRRSTPSWGSPKNPVSKRVFDAPERLESFALLLARPLRTRAFSLVELTIVVVIIGVLAAIAIPRMSRGSSAANESALTTNLAMLRSAIDLYQSDHNGAFPSATTIAAQLTQYTDETGLTSAVRTPVYAYGPYLRSIPALPVGAKKGRTKISATNAADVGWIYDAALGTIVAAAAETDEAGKAFSAY
jgi:general secretion pathway protein G